MKSGFGVNLNHVVYLRQTAGEVVQPQAGSGDMGLGRGQSKDSENRVGGRYGNPHNSDTDALIR